MKWEVKKLPDGRWGVFLCEEFWKYPDRPVCYVVSLVEAGAQRKVNRLNNPKYDFDANYVTVKQAREKARKEKAEAREKARKEKAEARAAKKVKLEKEKKV
tara:strand:+ start:408 stop:710 length:303 start_codon:yes stop_codon:yes gene_type:complete